MVSVHALLVGLFALSGSVAFAQKKPPMPMPTPEEERKATLGKWHVLLAHEGDRNRLGQPGYQASTVLVGEKSIDWLDVKGQPLWSAACEWKHVGKPAWEIDVTPRGSTTALPGIALLFDRDVLKLSWRRTAIEKGRTPNFNGNKEHTYLLLVRQAPAGVKGSPKLDGEWKMLAALDDAFDRLATERVGSVVTFDGEKFAWKRRPADKAVNFAGGYKVEGDSKPTKLRFTITFPPPGSGATPTPKDGFMPAVFEFLDDETLILCYRESGWKNTDPPESRQYPETFLSDGNLNLWILRRR